jgi:hypothetical protein
MNFFGHAAVACWRSRAPAFVLGSMLPDFAAMIRARPPASSHDEIRDGIGFHHRTDDAFHQAPSFVSLSRAARDELARRGLGRGSARAVAHVGVEILIDAALARDDIARDAYLAALGVAREGALGGEVGWRDVAERTRFAHLREALIGRGVAADDASPELVALRVQRTLQGRPRLALAAGDETKVRDWASRARTLVEAQIEQLLAELEAGLGVTKAV